MGEERESVKITDQPVKVDVHPDDIHRRVFIEHGCVSKTLNNAHINYMYTICMQISVSEFHISV